MNSLQSPMFRKIVKNEPFYVLETNYKMAAATGERLISTILRKNRGCEKS